MSDARIAAQEERIQKLVTDNIALEAVLRGWTVEAGVQTMSTVRALLYASTTAADLGQTVFDTKLPELRRFAGVRGFEIAGEFTDAVPRGIGKRPGFSALCAAAAAGKGDVVVALSVADLCWDLAAGFARLRELGLGTTIGLICVRSAFDATTPAGALRLLDAMELVAEHRRQRARERQQIGILLSTAKRHGVSFAGRPHVVLNIAEVKTLWEGGLSQPEMLAKLERLGAGVSKGTLSRAIRNALEAGSLDPRARTVAIEKRGGLRRGGRPTPVIRLDPDRLAALWHSGSSLGEIASTLSTASVKLSKFRLRIEIAAALERGELDPSRRARSKAKKPRKAAA